MCLEINWRSNYELYSYVNSVCNSKNNSSSSRIYFLSIFYAMCNLIFSLRARWLYDMNMESFLCICVLARFFAICMFKADGGYCSECAIRGEIGLKCVCFGNNEAFAKRAGFFCKCLIYWYIILLFFSHLLCYPKYLLFFSLTVCKAKKTFSKPNFILLSK